MVRTCSSFLCFVARRSSLFVRFSSSFVPRFCLATFRRLTTHWSGAGSLHRPFYLPMFVFLAESVAARSLRRSPRPHFCPSRRIWLFTRRPPPCLTGTGSAAGVCGHIETCGRAERAATNLR